MPSTGTLVTRGPGAGAVVVVVASATYRQHEASVGLGARSGSQLARPLRRSSLLVTDPYSVSAWSPLLLSLPSPTWVPLWRCWTWMRRGCAALAMGMRRRSTPSL